MKIVKPLLFILLVTFLTTAKAQDIKQGDKTLSFLKGQTKLNITYVYDGMMVGKKEEDNYKKEKIDYYNHKKAGRGKAWEEKWVSNRTDVYEPKFEDLLNRMLKKGKTNIAAAKGIADEKYTIQVKTIVMEPGANAVAFQLNPYCNIEIAYLKTSTGKIMAKGLLVDVEGIQVNDEEYDFDPAGRVGECYAKAGKTVGTSISKAMDK